MCKTCEKWGFKNWEFVQINSQRIRLQCPICKKFYGYMTMAEFQKQHPEKQTYNETSDSDHSDEISRG